MWAAELNPNGLSQGDILVDVPVGVTRLPLTFLSKEPWQNSKGGRIVWTQYESLQGYEKEPGAGHWISKGRIMMALVLTHSCDLDDIRDSERILVAPIWPAARVTSNDEDRRRIVAGERATYVGLPGVPDIGDCYADLRSICPLDRYLFGMGQRHRSMTDDAVLRLQAQLALYFTRIEPEHLVKALQGQMFAAAAAQADEKPEPERG